MYKPGDQIVIRNIVNIDDEVVTVGKIIYEVNWMEEQLYYCTEICGSTLPVNDSIKGNHYISINDNNIEGLYNGEIQLLDIIWKPKYNIGDAVSVKWYYFEEHPTWHTILGLRLLRFDNNISYGYMISGGSKEHGIMLFEDEILDVIRYGETR